MAVNCGLELAGGARDGGRRKELPADGEALTLQLVPHSFNVGTTHVMFQHGASL